VLSVATFDDIDELVELEEAMFDESIYPRLTQKEFQRLLGKKSTILYVWRDGKNIAGYALGVIINRQNIWFNSLAVLKEYQSSIVAKELFRAIEEYAKDSHFKTVILEIRADNKALFRRYTNFGYKKFKDIASYYPDGMGAIRLIKLLSA
jgi:ribosomal protein S18 acetylase RimI-like enzyme